MRIPMRIDTRWSITQVNHVSYAGKLWEVQYRGRMVAVFPSERRAKEYADWRYEQNIRRQAAKLRLKLLAAENESRMRVGAIRAHMERPVPVPAESGRLIDCDPGWTPEEPIGSGLMPSDT